MAHLQSSGKRFMLIIQPSKEAINILWSRTYQENMYDFVAKMV